MFDKTKKQWLNNIKKQVIEIPFSKAMLYILITFGLVLLVMFLFSLENKNHLAPLAILLASQIAGFSIIYTINNTNRLEQKKQEDEKVKTQKVLSSYFKHLIVLAKEQKKYFNELEIRIHKSPNTHLKDLMIIETSFEDDLNTIAFINPIESMLNPDLHKYSNEEMLNFRATCRFPQKVDY